MGLLYVSKTVNVPVVQGNEVEIGDLDWRPELRHEQKTHRGSFSHVINSMRSGENVDSISGLI